MSEIARVGVDLAKHVIQVHAVDASGKVVAAKALARDKFVVWCAQLPLAHLSQLTVVFVRFRPFG